MSARSARWLARSLWALTAAGLAIAVALPSRRGDDDLTSLVAILVFALSFATVGALVSARRGDNPIGWIMCAAGMSYGLGGLAVSYIESTPAGTEDGLIAFADWVSGWIWMVGIGLAATFLLLLFPSGRLPSPRWRAVARAASP